MLAGSTPPGVDAAVYARLIGELRGLACRRSSTRTASPCAWACAPSPQWWPQRGEAEEAVGHEFNDADDFALGLAGLLEMGAGEAVITREAGCVAIVGKGNERRRYEVGIEPLEPISGVGSGDCFLAGYVAARYEGRSASECLAYGVACGAESTQHFGAGSLDRNEVERLLPRVEVRGARRPCRGLRLTTAPERRSRARRS